MNTFIFLQGRAAGAWRGGFAQRLTAAAMLGFCLLTLRLPAPVPPTPDPGDYIYLQLSAYDLDGRAGLKRIYEEGVEGVWTKVYLGDSSIPAYSWNRMGNFYRSSELLYQAGTLFRFTVEHPRLGLFEGTAKIGEQGPLFIIPAENGQLGYDLTLQKYSLSDPPPDNGQHISLNIYPNIADSMRAECYAKTITSSSNTNMIGRIKIEYLPGSSFEAKGIQQKVMNINHFILVLFWSGYDFSQYPEPYFWGISHEAPTGPAKISIGIDGYTTDSTTVNLENLHEYVWNSLHKPLPNENVYHPTGYSFQSLGESTSPTLTFTPTASSTPVTTATITESPTVTSASTPTHPPSPLPTSSPNSASAGIFWVLR